MARIDLDLAHAYKPNPQRDGDVALPGKVELAEISGSDTFVHVDTPIGELVAQLTGVHYFDLGAQITLHLHPSQVYVFDGQGDLLVAPSREMGADPLTAHGGL